MQPVARKVLVLGSSALKIGDRVVAVHAWCAWTEKDFFEAKLMQIAVPAKSGRRELAATLAAAVGACPGRALEKSDSMAPPRDLPDETAARATLGYLSLGSRPSARRRKNMWMP